MDRMKDSLRDFLILIGAFNIEKYKCRLIHPIGLMVYLIIAGPIFIYCAFSNESFSDFNSEFCIY